MRDVIERHGCVKVNTAFNGEFVTWDKRVNKSVNEKFLILKLNYIINIKNS